MKLLFVLIVTTAPHIMRSVATFCHGLSDTAVTFRGYADWRSENVVHVAQVSTYRLISAIKSLALRKQVLIPR